MVVPERESEPWQVLRFLTRFAADREAGSERPLRDYLADYPGEEEAIAAEYLALTDGSSGPRRVPFPRVPSRLAG